MLAAAKRTDERVLQRLLDRGVSMGLDDWRASAACLGQVELMRDSDLIPEALEVCLRCPVIGPCRDFATADRQIRQLHRDNKRVRFQVIGGFSPNELARWLRSGTPAQINVFACLHCGHRFGTRNAKQKMCSKSCRKARSTAQRQAWGRERTRLRRAS